MKKVVSTGKLRKIVVIGPESTGKSTLCAQLAEAYQTGWVREYAREYLITHGKKYGYDDLLTIAKGQVALEEKGTPASGLLFIDTDLYVVKVWSEFVFGKCDPWILQQIVHRQYDHYLFCNTDLPWVKDELREYPDLATREKLSKIYQDILVNQSTPWTMIRGNYDQRLEIAKEVIDGLLK